MNRVMFSPKYLFIKKLLCIKSIIYNNYYFHIMYIETPVIPLTTFEKYSYIKKLL